MNLLRLFFASAICMIVFPPCSQASNNAAPKPDANFLLEQCRAAVHRLDGDKSVDLLSYGFCMGYVSGFAAGHDDAIFQNRYLDPKSNAKFIFCTTKRNVTTAQLARALVTFLTDHPQALNLPPDVLTLLAFKAAFPCSTSE